MTKTSDTIGGSAMFLIGLSVGVWLVLILVTIFSGFRPNYNEVEYKEWLWQACDEEQCEDRPPKRCYLIIKDLAHEIACAPEEK